MADQVGSAYLQVVPSFSGVVESISAEAVKWGQSAGDSFAESFKTVVNAELKDLDSAKIDADTSEATAKVQALRAEINNLHAQIDLGIDDGDTQLKIDELQAQLAALETEHPEVRIGVDTGAAEAELGAFEADVVATTFATDALGESAGAGGAGEDVEALGSSAAEAGGDVSVLAVAVGTLAVALLPIGGLVLAAFAAIPAIVAGATTAIAALGLGLYPIISALEAKGTSSGGGGGGSSDAATALANAEAERQAANSVQSAEEALNNARISGAASVKNAETAAAQATVNANQNVINSEQDLVNAERAVTQAQFEEQQAQQAVIDARQQAQDQLEDYTNQLADGAIAQQQAALNLQEAQEAYAAATAPGSTSTAEQTQQAYINLEQAQQAITDLNTQNTQLAQNASEAFAAGVDGASSVVDAENNLQNATQSVNDAVTAQQTAQENVAKAAKEAAAQEKINQENIGDAAKKASQSVSDAERALEQALDNQSDAYKRAAIPQAGAAAATETYAQKLAKLSPAGQDFVTFIEGTLIPAFTGLSGATQQALLPLLQDGLKELLPFFQDLKPFILDAATGIGQTVDAFGKFIGSGKGLSDTMQIFKIGNQFMSDFGTGILDLFEAFTSIGAQSQPIVDHLATGINNIIKSFLNWTNDGGFAGFLTWLKENGPSIANDLESFFKAVGDLVVVLTPVGGVLDDVIGFLSKLVSWVTQSWQIFTIFLGVAAGFIAFFIEVGTPIGWVVTAVGLVVVAILELVAHWKDVWGSIKTIGSDAWTFLKNDLFDPIADFFTKTIPAAFDDVISWFKGLPGRIATAIGNGFDAVWNLFVLTNDWLVSHILDPIETFFTTLPDKIGHLAEHMWDGIEAAFATVLDTIIGWWNDLHFHIPGFHIGPVGFGGFDLGMPQIPTIPIPQYHSGGVVQGEAGVEQLAMLMPGEIVIPQNAQLATGGGSGGVNLELNLYGVDMDNEAMVTRVVVDAVSQMAESLLSTRVA